MTYLLLTRVAAALPDNLINDIIMFSRPTYPYMKELCNFLSLHGDTLVKYQGRNTLNMLTMSVLWNFEYIRCV